MENCKGFTNFQTTLYKKMLHLKVAVVKALQRISFGEICSRLQTINDCKGLLKNSANGNSEQIKINKLRSCLSISTKKQNNVCVNI